MKNRKAIIHALLALLLLFSQQMVLAHAVSHFSGTPQKTADSKQLPAEQHCAQCLAHAQIGSGLTTQGGLSVTDAVADTVFAANLTPVPFAITFTAFRSRAPPSL